MPIKIKQQKGLKPIEAKVKVTRLKKKKFISFSLISQKPNRTKSQNWSRSEKKERTFAMLRVWRWKQTGVFRERRRNPFSRVTRLTTETQRISGLLVSLEPACVLLESTYNKKAMWSEVSRTRNNLVPLFNLFTEGLTSPVWRLRLPPNYLDFSSTTKHLWLMGELCVVWLNYFLSKKLTKILKTLKINWFSI